MALPNGGSAYQVSDGNPNAAKSLGGTILLSNTGAGLFAWTCASPPGLTGSGSSGTCAAGGAWQRPIRRKASCHRRMHHAENAQEIRPAHQDLRGLQAALHLAQEMGAGLGKRDPLL